MVDKMKINFEQVKSYRVLENIKEHRSVLTYIIVLLLFWPAVILLVMFPKDTTIVQIRYLDGNIQKAKVSQTELGVIKMWAQVNRR